MGSLTALKDFSLMSVLGAALEALCGPVSSSRDAPDFLRVLADHGLAAYRYQPKDAVRDAALAKACAAAATRGYVVVTEDGRVLGWRGQ